MSDETDLAEMSRRRRTTRHLILSVVAVAVFGGAVAVLAYQRAQTPEPVPSPSTSSSASPSQSLPPPQQPTLLIQVTTGQGAVGDILTAVTVDEPARATAITLPPDLVVSSSGSEPQSIRTTVSSLDTLLAPNAVATTLGVRVDGSWRMDRKALAGLVDSIGGVEVEVPELMRIRDEEGKVVLRVQPGVQRLSGVAASWYAVGQVPRQPDAVVQARFEDVMMKTLAALPDDQLAVRESVTALGALAPSTIATQDLANYLVDLGSAMRSAPVDDFTLPTTPVVIGHTTYRWTDYRQATPRIKEALSLALWDAQLMGAPRVLVLAPPDEPGWIGSARVPLEGEGMIFVDGRGTTITVQRRSQVVVRASNPWGTQVAAALGLPTGDVTRTPASQDGPASQPWADVDVMLGKDYVPQP